METLILAIWLSAASPSVTPAPVVIPAPATAPALVRGEFDSEDLYAACYKDPFCYGTVA